MGQHVHTLTGSSSSTGAKPTYNPVESPRPRSHQDDDLVRLRDAWEASGLLCSEFAQARCDARDRMTRPPLPDALRYRAATDATYIGQYQNRSRLRPFGYTDPEQIDRLRGLCSPKLHARRDEIVTAFDAWQAAVQSDKDSSGYTEADAAWTAEIDRHNELERQIARTPALGREGLAAKMAVALGSFENEDGVVTDDEIVQEIEYHLSRGTDHQSEALPLSVLLDLKRQLRAGIAESVNDDAPLLTAVAEFCRVDDLQNHLCRTYHADTDDIPGYAETEVPWHAWLDQVADRPALTWEGIVAKAATMKRHSVHHDLGKTEAIGDSIVEDILRLAGRTWDQRSNRVPRSAAKADAETRAA